MKKFLQGCMLLCILSVTACSKENLTINASQANGSSSRLYGKTASVQSTSSTGIPGFDDEVFDVPLFIKTSIAKNLFPTLQMKDSVYHYFNGDYSNSIVAGEDIIDVPRRNTENLAISRAGGLYSAEGRMVVASGYSDTIQLHTAFKAYTAYKVRVEPFNFPSGFSIRILDSYLHTSSPVPLSGITTLHILIQDLALSPTDRFTIIVQRH